MINIYCYNWNLKLSPQGIIDSNCGYHAIKNGNVMLNLLNTSNINYNNYLKSIKKSKKFNYLTSKEYTDKEITKYNKVINSNSLSKDELYKIIRGNNLDRNIFVSYCDKEIPFFNFYEDKQIKDLMKKDTYRFCVIIFKKEFSIAKHWIPIVFDKNKNILHLHILDSYDMVWWGEQNLSQLVDYLYPKKKVFCVNDYKQGGSYYYVTKLLYFLVLVLAVYLFIFGMFEVKKLKP